MRRIPRTLFPIVAMAVIAIVAVLYISYQNTNASKTTVISGTIEVTEIHLGTQLGGLIDAIYVKEGESTQKGEIVAEVQPAAGVSAGYTEKVRSPIDGVVLDRPFQPGELATPGTTLLVVGDLTSLTLTVYVPEEKVGEVSLGQAYPVSVDSFPGRQFTGTVSYISNTAEFTPRNVQTIQGRKDTVYAVKLTLDNPGLELKPGMPADVTLEAK